MTAVRGGPAGLRAAQRRDGAAVRRRRRSAPVGLVLVAVGAGRVRCSSAPTTPIWVLLRALLRPGRRHGQRDAAGHRVDHVGAAPGEGRRRLGGEQHRPPGRRRAGRRGARLGALRGLPQRHRRRRRPACRPRRGTPPSSRSPARTRWRRRLGPAGAGADRSAANDAFVTAMHWAAAARRSSPLLGIVVVLRWMPRRPAPPRCGRAGRAGGASAGTGRESTDRFAERWS